MDLCENSGYCVCDRQARYNNAKGSCNMQTQTTNNTIAPEELMEKLGAIAAEVFAIGIEEETHEIAAFKDVIRIIGKARELPGESVDKALANLTSLITAIRSAEPGKETDVIDGERVREPENGAGAQIIQALVDICEWVNDPDEWHQVDGLINYLEDYWNLKAPAAN